MSNVNIMDRNQAARRTRVRAKAPIPKITIIFFCLFLLNTIVSLFDLPVIGLSLTAPLMFFVMIQVLLKPSRPWLKTYSTWWILAGAIWVGWFTSAILNSVLGKLDPFSSSYITYHIRTAYWLFVMVVTIYVVSQTVHGNFLLQILNIGVFILGAIRMIEALLFQRIGAGTSVIMTQNGYGLLFSSFAVYPITLIFITKGWKKIIQLFMVAVVYGAIIINSSRSSWLALIIGLFVLFILLFRAHRIKISQFIPAIIILFMFYILSQLVLPNIHVPLNSSSPIIQRLQTFQNLEEDVSFATRQYLVNKGLTQFQSSPIIGIGIERGQKGWMGIEIPEILTGKQSTLEGSLNAHNSYIPVLAETGLMGAIPFGSLILYLFIRGFRSAVYLSKRENIWAAGIFASFVSMTIHLYTITGLRNTAAWVVYGLVGGMIMFAQRLHRTSTN